MDSIVVSLPNELVSRVFSFLAEDKETIKACRLVCRTFKESSSPFLITRVVFARRMKTIAYFNEIVHHDYFHKYVTELLYDASSYDEMLATEWSAYLPACEEAPQEFLDDEDWVQGKHEDLAFWRSIYGTEGVLSERILHPAQAADTATGDRSVLTDGAETHDNNSDPEIIGSEDGVDKAFWFGCRRSYLDYYRRYEAERRTKHGGMIPRLLERAFSKLTSLRSVFLADWRSLAKDGESCSECARRLFGNTLAPTVRNDLSNALRELTLAI